MERAEAVAKRWRNGSMSFLNPTSDEELEANIKEIRELEAREPKSSNLDLIAQLRAPCGDSVTLLIAEGSPDKYDPLRLAAAREIERLREIANKRSDYINELQDTLAALWRETCEAGNDKAEDFGWPGVREKVLKALRAAPETRDG